MDAVFEETWFSCSSGASVIVSLKSKQIPALKAGSHGISA